MLTWIKLDTQLSEHTKILDTAALWGWKRREVAGLLQALWTWAARVTTDGHVTITPGIIRSVLEWDGDCDQLLADLVSSRWLDKNGDGTYQIHNWDEHQGALVDAKEAHRLVEANRRAAKKAEIAELKAKLASVTVTCPSRDSHVSSKTSHVQHESRVHETRPDEKKEEKKPAPKAAKGKDYSLEFEQFWSIYPRTTGMSKVAAYRCWNTCVKTYKAKPEELIASAEHYRQQCVAKRTEEQFMKHPTTWLGPDKHYEPFITGIPGGNTNGTHQQPPAAVKRTSGGWSGRLATVKSDTDTGDKPTPATPDEAAGKRDVSILPGVN